MFWCRKANNWAFKGALCNFCVVLEADLEVTESPFKCQIYCVRCQICAWSWLLVQKGSPANINVYNNMTFYFFKDITMQKKMVGLIHNYSIPHKVYWFSHFRKLSLLLRWKKFCLCYIFSKFLITTFEGLLPKMCASASILELFIPTYCVLVWLWYSPHGQTKWMVKCMRHNSYASGLCFKLGYFLSSGEDGWAQAKISDTITPFYLDYKSWQICLKSSKWSN